MKQYSIKDLEKFTGIKAHTLRMWEQRYSLFAPTRSETNIRSYSEADVKKALNIKMLYSNGYKISKIASLTDLERCKLIDEIFRSVEKDSTTHICDLFVHDILSYNEGGIKSRFELLKKEYSVVEAYGKIYVPLLFRIGELWHTGSLTIAQEHFFSNLLRDFFIGETKNLVVKVPLKKEKAVLFLHENEMHEIGLLIIHHVLKSLGVECIYLGARVPMESLKHFVKQVNPEYMFTSLVSGVNKPQIQKLINEMATFFDISKLVVSGVQAELFKNDIPNRVVKAHGVKDIEVLFN